MTGDDRAKVHAKVVASRRRQGKDDTVADPATCARIARLLRPLTASIPAATAGRPTPMPTSLPGSGAGQPASNEPPGEEAGRLEAAAMSPLREENVSIQPRRTHSRPERRTAAAIMADRAERRVAARERLHRQSHCLRNARLADQVMPMASFYGPRPLRSVPLAEVLAA